MRKDLKELIIAHQAVRDDLTDKLAEAELHFGISAAKLVTETKGRVFGSDLTATYTKSGEAILDLWSVQDAALRLMLEKLVQLEKADGN